MAAIKFRMKRFLLTTIFFGCLASLSAQDLVEKISVALCNCVDTIISMDSLNAKLNRCAPDIIDSYFSNEDEDEDNMFASNDTVEKTMDAVIRNLGYYCPKIRKFVLADKESRFYKMSESAKANDLYNKGNESYKAGDYKNAEKLFMKALKIDPKFVYSWDDMALTCRKEGNYKKAIKYYSKSLAIFPEGSYALQDRAVAYTYIKDYARAYTDYMMLANLYPDNPEGFYGIAKIDYLKGDYDEALDFAFYTHKMYVTATSEYAKDTENLIKLIHDKLKELDKLDL